jgi:integrase
VNRFAAAFGDRNLATITGEEIKRWLDATFPDAVTRANTRRVLVNFFNIAQAKKFTGSNPAAETRVRKEAAREIGILTPVEVGALLEHSTTDILPYFCIGAFAGIRPEELQRLEWSDFRWKQGILRIRAEVSKVGAARNVRIEPNLSAWLAPYRLSSGRICPAGWREQFRATRAAAGIGTWPHDCLRHSFATYWLEKHKDAPALALEMGNSVEVILRHYSKVLGKR